MWLEEILGYLQRKHLISKTKEICKLLRVKGRKVIADTGPETACNSKETIHNSIKALIETLNIS